MSSLRAAMSGTRSSLLFAQAGAGQKTIPSLGDKPLP